MQALYIKRNIGRYIFLSALIVLAVFYIVRATSVVGSADPAESKVPLATETVTETATAIATETTTQTATASATVIVPSCELDWKIFPTTNLGNGMGTIHDIEVISSDDVWAVGQFAAGTLTETQGLIMHWDGAVWSKVDAPELGAGSSGTSALYSVSASSPNDVWAVGNLRIVREPPDPSYDTYTYTLHWDGSRWTAINTPIIPFPNYLGLRSNPINRVVALSPTDAWAAGFEDVVSDKSSWINPFLIHWDGVQWNRVTCECDDYILDLDVLVPNDVWVIARNYENRDQHKISRWDGSTWTSVALPVLDDALLEDMEVVSADSIWVVGSMPNGTGGRTPLSLHWNGSTWENMSLPLNESARLYSLDVISDNDVWAVGEAGCADYTTCIQIGPLVLHWDGTQWSRMPAPQLGSMRAVDVASDGMIWTGGSLGDPWFVLWNGATWQQQPSSLRGENDNFLLDIEDGRLAVGGYVRARHVGGTVTRTLVQRLNGQAWSVVPTPNEPYNSYLNAVSTAPGGWEAWAVGRSERDGGSMLIEHWDSYTDQWSIVPLPSLLRSELTDVKAIDENNVWAVGTEDAFFNPKPILLHWDGAQWSRIESPVATGSLNALHVLSYDNIWAVGGDGQGLILHWDGTQWSGGSYSHEGLTLYAVASVSSTDVWAVGTRGYIDPIFLHYDGTTWEEVSGPSVLPGASQRVRSIAAQGGEVWVGGDYTVEGGNVHALLLYYDGSEWTVVETADVGDEGSKFNDLAVINSEDIWAVGSYNTGLAERVLIEHYPTLYTDVMPYSTFYPYIHCLSCRGIINGYDDGTFRPGNALTRGQLSKIVSNAAQYSEPVGDQQFEDVVPGSTFFDFIWRLADRGHITGYPCGGVGEPCGAGNLPYFRPGSTATRGQISKIVSNAAGFTEPPGSQAFEDVPEGSTFYLYVQRLALHQVMSGYPCGTVGEPCGQNFLPYFRPGNNATRGQTAKIVSNTFYPECGQDEE